MPLDEARGSMWSNVDRSDFWVECVCPANGQQSRRALAPGEVELIVLSSVDI